MAGIFRPGGAGVVPGARVPGVIVAQPGQAQVGAGNYRGILPPNLGPQVFGGKGGGGPWVPQVQLSNPDGSPYFPPLGPDEYGPHADPRYPPWGPPRPPDPLPPLPPIPPDVPEKPGPHTPVPPEVLWPELLRKFKKHPPGVVVNPPTDPGFARKQHFMNDPKFQELAKKMFAMSKAGGPSRAITDLFKNCDRSLLQWLANVSDKLRADAEARLQDATDASDAAGLNETGGGGANPMPGEIGGFGGDTGWFARLELRAAMMHLAAVDQVLRDIANRLI